MRPDLAPLAVAVAVDAPQELVHASHVLAGLADLRAAGRIRSLRVGVAPRLHRGELHLRPDGTWDEGPSRARKTTFLTVTHPGGRLRLAADLRDAATTFAADALAADVCAKRSYLDGPAATAEARGATHLGRTLRLGAALHAAAIADAVRPDRRVVARLRSQGGDARYQWRTHRRAFTTDRARRPPAPPATDGTVLFQTRAFADEAGDAPEVHEQRAALIRALRDHLGPRFRGGFVPDAFTRARFPDCLSDVDPRPGAYLDAVDRAAVVVSTRGVADSAPHKLCDLLARGRPVVSEVVPHRLPAPLVDGEHLRTFTDLDGCLAAYDAVLAAGGAGLGAAGRRYYEDWIDPPVAVHRMLATTLELAG